VRESELLPGRRRDSTGRGGADKRFLTRVLPVLALALWLAVPAAATDDATDDPCRDEDGTLVLEERQAWIKDHAGTKAGNAAAVGATEFPSWDDEPPDQSVSDGAGGGYFASSAGALADAQFDPTYAATLAGDFDGCLDTMAVTLYLFSSFETIFLEEQKIGVQLFADGEWLFGTDDVDVVSRPNPDGDITHSIHFAFRNLLRELELVGLDPAGEHELTLQVTPRYNDVGHVVFVWDTTEVPSNIIFNAGDLNAYTTVN
jgi:hypothetical protein